MRFSNLAVGFIMAYNSVDAAPQIFGFPLFAPPPRPIPGPGITVPSPVKAPQVPRPAPIATTPSPSSTGNSGNTLPALPPANSSAIAPSSAAVFSPTSSAPVATPTTIPIPPINPGNTAPAVQIQACAADVDRLASGIQQNILDQQGELVTAQGLLAFLLGTVNGTRNGINATAVGNTTTAAPSPDKNLGLFMALKGQLLAFITAGVALRTGNQAIAPPGSLAANGLAQIANAQQTELGLASSLTGDPTIDVATIQTLLQAFNDGIKLNMQNLLDATQNCTPKDLIAQRGVQVALRAGLKAVLPVPVPAYTPDATTLGNMRRVRRGSAYNYE